ncbi:Hypothetical predicted protein [Octopus vulgaris]|uniref:Uncharacterized protein n=1 Tax=Octopus vulgaris TaxID=6645 RepID=A0AA36F7H2_OCTVU|nr:Hypothetical predicted protein [Octopus vulgaris]
MGQKDVVPKDVDEAMLDKETSDEKSGHDLAQLFKFVAALRKLKLLCDIHILPFRNEPAKDSENSKQKTLRTSRGCGVGGSADTACTGYSSCDDIDNGESIGGVGNGNVSTHIAGWYLVEITE